ncbi:MAG: hypothetical protein WBE18_00575, partial [Gammaproteobacteria bacterium]
MYTLNQTQLDPSRNKAIRAVKRNDFIATGRNTEGTNNPIGNASAELSSEQDYSGYFDYFKSLSSAQDYLRNTLLFDERGILVYCEEHHHIFETLTDHEKIGIYIKERNSFFNKSVKSADGRTELIKQFEKGHGQHLGYILRDAVMIGGYEWSIHTNLQALEGEC